MQEKMAAEARMAEKTAIAVKLLALGLEIDFVVKATGLKKKVVEGLAAPSKVGGVVPGKGGSVKGK
jgi:hypothetical protein